MNTLKPAKLGAGSFSRSALLRWAVFALLGSATQTGFAQLADAASDALAPALLAPRVEARVSTIPQLDSNDGAFGASRVNLSWMAPGKSPLGLSADMSALSPQRGPGVGATSITAVDLGVRWSHLLEGSGQIDVTAWHRLAPPQDTITLIQRRQPLYGARVEMRLADAGGKGWVAERGFVGLQLDGGARIGLRKKEGRPTLYYRVKF